MARRRFAIVVVLAMVGCRSRGDRAGTEPAPAGPAPAPTAPAPTAPSAPAPAPAPAPSSGDTSCELPRAACLASPHCTLEHVADDRYRCRPQRGRCEVGRSQTDRRACEAIAGCAFAPGACYCPFPGYGATQVPDEDDGSGGACACGGGPPSSCVEAGPDGP